MNDRHIVDDRLIDICVSRGARDDEQAHLDGCARCESRRVEIVGILAELDEAATHEAVNAFPQARLERQHARILRRVDHHGRPGQLVAFPAAQPRTTHLPSRPRVRWAAAASAAAFVAGVVTGNWTHTFTASETRPSHIVATEVGTSALRAVPTTFSEEEFLGQIEVAASRNGPVALRPLDVMTPKADESR